MKGLKDVDPTKQPSDIVTFTAILGWSMLFAYLVSEFVEFVSTLTWFQ